VVGSVINAFLSPLHASPVPPLGNIGNLPYRAPLFDRVDQLPSGCAGRAYLGSRLPNGTIVHQLNNKRDRFIA
jgi:hypothetical protein